MSISVSWGIPTSTVGGLYSDVPEGTDGKYPPPIEPFLAADASVEPTGEICVDGSLMFCAGKTGGEDRAVDCGRDG